jgi:endonuclease YncB( thermonuclease family)
MGARTFTLTRLRVFLIVAVTLLASTQAFGREGSFTGKLVAIADGDTIEVMHNVKTEKVRLPSEE